MAGAPSTSLATQRPDLRDSFMEFDLEANMRKMIGRNVYSVIDVGAQSGNFGRIPLEQLLMTRTTLRAPRTGYSRQNYTFVPDTYATEEHGAEETVDDREAQMFRNYFQAEQVAAARAMSATLLNYEARVAAKAFDTTTYAAASQSTAAGVPWSTHATADPRADIEAAMQAIWGRTGIWPNTLVVGLIAYRNLMDCDAIIDRVKYHDEMPVNPGSMTKEAIAKALGIERIEIGSAVQNTANIGQDAVLAPIWSSTEALVCQVAMSQDPTEPCIGRTFHWAADGSSIEGQMESYRDETVRGDIIRVRHDTGEKTMYLETGQLLTTVTA